MKRKILTPSTVATPGGPYSHAIAVDEPARLLFTAGQVALGADGQLVGKGDVAAQAKQVYDNIANLVQAAGGTMADIVQFRAYLTSRDLLSAFVAARNEVFAEAFPDKNYPTSTLVIVTGLANPDWLIEVEAVAAI